MQPVDPHQFVAEIHLDEHQTGQHEIKSQKALRQDSGILLASHVAPSGEQSQHTGKGPADGAMDIEDVSRGPVGIGEAGFDLSEDDGNEDCHCGDEQIPEADFKEVLLSGHHPDHVEDDRDQCHGDHEVDDDRMNDVEPGEIFIVERR